MNCKALAVMKSGRTLKTLLTAIVVFASMITGMAQVPSYVPANGLVGWWPFNGNANDESGNGNNGTVNGATLTSDRNGVANAAYSFDGVSNYISVADNNSIDLSNQLTISCWFKSNSNNINQYAVGKPRLSANSGYGLGYKTYNNGDSISLGLQSTTPTFISIASSASISSINSNLWSLLVGTYDGVSAKIYINGVLLKTISTNLILDNSPEPLFFGKELTSFPYRYFSGWLDDIGIWNRALTQNEITQLYTGSPCVNYQIITITDTLIINANLSGINPVTFQNTIKVYPNPSSSQITIDFGANFNTLAGYTMRIQNAVGQTVYTTGVTQQQFTSNLNTWTGNGIYFVYLIDAQGNTVDVKKIILQ